MFTFLKFIKTTSLKKLLENDGVTKLLWDLRCDNNALIFQFEVRMAGAVDLQLLETAWRLCRGDTPATVGGLGWTLENTDRGGLTSAERYEMARVKAAARALFAPEHGGGYSVWRRRPLPDTLIQYCTDAHTFFALRATFSGAERAHGAALAAAVRRRLAASSRRDYETTAPDRLRAVDPLLVSDIRAALQAAPAAGARAATETAVSESGFGRYRAYDYGGHDTSDYLDNSDGSDCYWDDRDY